MKTYSKIFFTAAVAAFGFASCAQEELAPAEKPQDNLVTVHFGAESQIATTKATLTTEDEKTFRSAWENGDVLSVEYSYNYGNPATTAAEWKDSNFEAQLAGDTGLWIYDAVYPAPASDKQADFGSSRKQNGNLYNSKYDFMYGSATAENAAAGKTDDGKDIVFNMNRQTAIAYFHLTGTLDEEVVSAKLSVDGEIACLATSSAELVEYAKGYKFDESGSNALKEITLTFDAGTAPKASDFSLWFNVLPTIYSKMTLSVETSGHTLTISKTAKDEDDGTYEAGQLYKVVKEIPAEKWVAKSPSSKDFELVTTAESDWTGMYLLVGTNDAKYYAFDEAQYTDNSWGTCSSVIVENNAISYSYNSMALEIIEGTSAGTYSIKTPSGKYLSASAAKKFNLVDTYSSDACDFKLTVGEKNALVIMQASSTNNRQVRYNYNNGKGGMRWYDGTTSNVVYLYKGPSKTSLETPANLSVSDAKLVSWDAVNGAASYNVTIGSETYTSETNSYDASAIEDEYYDVAVVAIPSDTDNYKKSAAATLTAAKFGTPTLTTPVLKAGAVDETSVAVTWTVDERATGGYICEIYADETKVAADIVTEGSVAFSGLTAETEYVVKVNAVAVEGEKPYAASAVATITLTTNNDGSLEHPYTAAEAITVIDGGTGLTKKYVKGIVKTAPTFNATYSSLTYDIESGDATLNIYSGLDLGNTGFVGADDLKQGDEVVVFGDLKKYNSTYEMDKNNYLISVNGETEIYRGLFVSGQKSAFTISDDFEFGGKVLQVWRGRDDVDVTASATFSGYDMSVAGKQTVTVTAGSETATYEITVKAAGTVTYTLQFGENYNSGKIQNYTSSWTATVNGFTWNLVNWNNNQNKWEYVKAGPKNGTSNAKITTAAAISEAISTIKITIDDVSNGSITSIALKSSVSDSFDAATTIETKSSVAKGEVTFEIASPQENLYYQLDFTLKNTDTKNNGVAQVSKVTYSNE